MPSVRLSRRHRDCMTTALGLNIVVRGSMDERLICHHCRQRIDLRRDNYFLMQASDGAHPMTDVAAHMACHEEQRPPSIDEAAHT